MTVKAIITADCCYRVEGDSYEPQGNICLEGSNEPVQIKPGSVLETYLRTIDLCNDSQMIQDERGLWGITGGPTEGALKVLAAKAQLASRCPPGRENPVRLAVQVHGDPSENGRRRAGADYRRRT